MAEYTKVFDNPYPSGWEDLPSENTPITASALQEHTDAIEHIEQYLEDNPIEKGGSDVEWNQIVKSGTKIAEVTIEGETTDVYAPQGGGGGTSFTTGNELALENDVLRYKANYGKKEEFETFKRRSDVPVGATYHVTDDYVEGGGSPKIYDDTEKVIGTWFGKTLYQKTIQFTTSDSARNFKNIANITGFEIHNLYGFVDTIPINYFYFDANNLLNSGTSVLVNSAKTSLLSISYGTQYLNKNGNVTIEYTKAGD